MSDIIHKYTKYTTYTIRIFYCIGLYISTVPLLRHRKERLLFPKELLFFSLILLLRSPLFFLLLSNTFYILARITRF